MRKFIYQFCFQKKFTKTPEFQQASTHLPSMKLPESIIQKARQVFSKYPSEDLRNASYDYMKMYQNIHAQEFPRSILQTSKPFDNAIPQTPKSSDDVIHLRDPNLTEEQVQDRIKKRTREQIEFSPTSQTSSYLHYDQKMAVCNLLRKAPSSYSIGKKLFAEVKKRMPDFQPEWIMDYGAGLGPFTWAVSEIYPSCKNLVCIEPNKNMRKLGKFIFDKSTYMESLAHTVQLETDQYDLIVIGFVLEEIKTAEGRQMIIQSLWQKLKDDGVMIYVGPGSPMGFRFIRDLREWIIKQDGNIISPCPHMKECPLAKEGFAWCHFPQLVDTYPKDVFPKHIHEKQQIEQKFTYLSVTKQKLEKQEWDRILFPPQKRGTHVQLDLCTSEGKYEKYNLNRDKKIFNRRKIAKSHGIEGGFYEAKKLRWGDRWRFEKRIPNKLRKIRKGTKRLF